MAPLQRAFVIMSFGADRLANYEQGIRAPIESLGIQCCRVDQLPGVGTVYDNIRDNLRESFLVVADLTDERPNCYYELGFVHALGRQRDVVIVLQEGHTLHFDVGLYKTIRYRDAAELASRLRDTTIECFLTNRTHRKDDPQSGRFGRCAIANGRLLMAAVESVDEYGSGESYRIRLQVEALPGHPPLVGKVTFWPHPDWRVTTVEAVDGIASTELKEAVGAFTVGAEADDGKTRLEFDLARLPGLVPGFYNPELQD